MTKAGRTASPPPAADLTAEVASLRARLAESEDVLRAIRNGEVDAVVVAGERGEQVYTLGGADRVYRQLIETMSEGAVSLSADGVILYCNARVAQMLGQPLNRLLGTLLGSYLSHADRDVLASVLAQARTEPSRREIRLKTSEGRVVPVYLSASRLEGEGAELAFCLLLTDLTEQKSHEKLAAAERLARLMLEQAAEAIVVCDEEGRVIRASQAAHELCGGDPLERPFAEVFPLFGASGPFLLTPVLRGATLRGADVALELGGRRLDLILNAGPLVSGAQILGCVVNLTDITERRRGEAERELLTTAIEQAAEAVVITDSKGAVVYVNPAFEAVTGYAREEVLGRNPRVLKSGVHDEAFYSALWGTISRGKTWQGRLVNRKKDGSHYSEDATISPVRDAAGVIQSYVAVKRDVTGHLALEAQFLQAQKMEGIGRLAGGVAHDFNNLLSVILSYTDFVMEELPEGDALRHDLLEVKTAGKRAAGLTRQLLAFSRKQVLQPVPLDLNRILTEMERMLRRIIGEDIELVQVQEPSLGVVKADPGQIEQVIMNLVVNARDAMPEGGRLILETANVELDAEYAASRAQVAQGSYVMVAVTDSGIGMDEETVAQIFEPFFTTKGVGKGTGLGLSTVYGIVSQSGGDILVVSEPGRGTAFKIYLPRDVSAAVAPIRAARMPRQTTGSETILVVEDEEALRRVAKRTLEAAGYTVLIAADGSEALGLCAQFAGRIDLLLTDVVMPRMGGKVLARELGKTRSAMKVLYMSGYSDDAIVHEGGVLDAGTHFIGKPFTAVELTRKLREVLDGRAASAPRA